MLTGCSEKGRRMGSGIRVIGILGLLPTSYVTLGSFPDPSEASVSSSVKWYYQLNLPLGLVYEFSKTLHVNLCGLV